MKKEGEREAETPGGFINPFQNRDTARQPLFLSLMFVLSNFFHLLVSWALYKIIINAHNRIVPIFLMPVTRLLMPKEMCLECNSFTLRIIFKWWGISFQPSLQPLHVVSAARRGEVTAW